MRSATFLITLILPTLAYAALNEPDEHPLAYVLELPEKEQIDVVLDLLQRGTDSERRWIAEMSGSLLWSLDYDEDDEWAIKRMNRLREWITREQDDFVLSNVVQGITHFEDVIVAPLFLELLSHPSPNVRHKAILYYSDWGEDPAALPILEGLWESGTREWIRDDLMLALAEMESTCFIDEFAARARGDDVSSATLAVEALGYMEDSRAMVELIELARDRTYPLRAEAVSEIAFWPESSEARGALLEASRDDDDEIRETAVFALVSIEDAPEVAARLLEVAGSDTSPDVRYAALSGLSSDDAEVAAVLHEIAGGPRTPETETLVDYAERQLAPPVEADPYFLELLVRESAGEEIDWKANGYELETITISCGLTYAVNPASPEAYLLQSDPGRTTTRCWSAPGVAADFVVLPRIERSSVVEIDEHHEYQGADWVRLLGESAWGCWVPRERLDEVPEDWPATPADRPSLHEELDLFTDDSRLAAVWDLEEHGTVEFFDRDRAGGVEAVMVDLPPAQSAVLTLLDSYRGTDGPFDQLVFTLLRKVPRELTLEPEVRSRLDALLPQQKNEQPTSP